MGAIPFVLVLALATTVNLTHSDAVVASCEADAKSIETAAFAYQAQPGQWPQGLSPLTQTATSASGQTVGPCLKSLPSTQDYTIFLSPKTGAVYVYPPNATQPSSFSSANAFDDSTGAPCLSIAS